LEALAALRRHPPPADVVLVFLRHLPLPPRTRRATHCPQSHPSAARLRRRCSARGRECLRNSRHLRFDDVAKKASMALNILPTGTQQRDLARRRRMGEVLNFPARLVTLHLMAIACGELAPPDGMILEGSQ